MSKIGVSFIFLLVVSITYASIVNGLDYEVSRQFQKSSVETDDELDVKIIVDVGPNTDAYVIDEIIPQGWTIISSGGGSTNHTGHIKWVVCGETSGHSYDCTGLTCCINQIQDTEYIYTLKAPTSEGMGVFTGNYMFDTDLSEHTILGDTTIQVVNTASDCRGYSSEQQCSANTNCSWCPIGTGRCREKDRVECKSQGCITSSTFCTSSCRLSYCGSTQTCSNGVCISTTSSTGGSATSGGGGGSISTLNTGGTPACLPVWTCVWGECNNVGGTGIQSGNCTDTACNSPKETRTKPCRLPSTLKGMAPSGDASSQDVKSPPRRSDVTRSSDSNQNLTASIKRTPSEIQKKSENIKNPPDTISDQIKFSNNMFYVFFFFIVGLGCGAYFYYKKGHLSPKVENIDLSSHKEAIAKLEQRNNEMQSLKKI